MYQQQKILQHCSLSLSHSVTAYTDKAAHSVTSSSASLTTTTTVYNTLLSKVKDDRGWVSSTPTTLRDRIHGRQHHQHYFVSNEQIHTKGEATKFTAHHLPLHIYIYNNIYSDSVNASRINATLMWAQSGWKGKWWISHRLSVLNDFRIDCKLLDGITHYVWSFRRRFNAMCLWDDWKHCNAQCTRKTVNINILYRIHAITGLYFAKYPRPFMMQTVSA